MRIRIHLTFALIALCNLSSRVLADEPAAAPKNVEFLARRVRVLDPDMSPVAGAVVKPMGFRTRIERGSHYSWHEPQFGPRPSVTTDEAGIATIRVPKHVHEELEIGEVSWTVDHHDFVTYYKDHSIDEKPAVVVLSNGYRIAATAVKDDGTPIREHLFAAISGSGWTDGHEWSLSAKGVLVSRVFGRERSTLRFIQLIPNEPARFSELLNVESPDGDRVFLKDIVLKPGVRVEGKLDPAVPRPVTNGTVSAYISAAPTNKQMTDRMQLWRWNDAAKIEPDGSFVLESLPQGEVVQVVALCDGWVSRNPTADDVKANVPWHTDGINGSRTAPQVFTLKGTRIQPVVLMDRTATCEIKVVKPDGTPLANATVSMWPNHIWLRGGSTLLGFGLKTTDLLQRQRVGSAKMIWEYSHRFESKTNQEGIAVIANLHGRGDVGMGVIHASYDQAISRNDRSTNVALEPGETQRITIQMQAKGSDVIGR